MRNCLVLLLLPLLLLVCIKQISFNQLNTNSEASETCFYLVPYIVYLSKSFITQYYKSKISYWRKTHNTILIFSWNFGYTLPIEFIPQRKISLKKINRKFYFLSFDNRTTKNNNRSDFHLTFHFGTFFLWKIYSLVCARAFLPDRETIESIATKIQFFFFDSRKISKSEKI